TEKFGKSPESFSFKLVSPGTASSQEYLRVLDKYLAIASCLLPQKPHSIINRPTLRRPGTHFALNNISIDPETFKITFIIGWQHPVSITPTPVAGHLNTFDYSPPASFNGIEPGEKPHGYADMSVEERAHVGNSGINKLHLEALRVPPRLLTPTACDLVLMRMVSISYDDFTRCLA
ncbi:phosphotransferase enzyme family protein, partial [Penicillium canescens]